MHELRLGSVSHNFVQQKEFILESVPSCSLKFTVTVSYLEKKMKKKIMSANYNKTFATERLNGSIIKKK